MKKPFLTYLLVILLLLPAIFGLAQRSHEITPAKKCFPENSVFTPSPGDGITSLFTEDFSGGTFPPPGWTVIGPGQTNWVVMNSNFAGGVPPEAKFYWSPSFVGNSRLVTPPIATSGNDGVILKVKHFLDEYGGAGAYTLFIETTSDGGTTWNEIWSLTDPGYNIGPAELSFYIENDDVGSDNFQIAFRFDGDSYQLDGWFFDDILLIGANEFDAAAIDINVLSLVSAGTTISLEGSVMNMGSETISFDVSFEIVEGTTPIYSQILTVANLVSFQTATLTFPDWVSYAGNFEVVLTTLLVGDEDPSNDQMTQPLDVVAGIVLKKPLYEEFTSSTCAPCAMANPILDGVLEANPGTHTLIKYQMNWPGSGDPYYTAEGGVRKDYYGVFGVPDLYINADNYYPGDMTQAIYDSYLDDVTAMTIDITTAEIDENYNIEVEADINVITPYAAGLTAHIVIVEKVTVGNVGSNGETEFHHVMLKMLPDAYGTTLGALNPGTTVTLSQTYDMSQTFMEEPNDLLVVVFVQDNFDKSLIQSEDRDVDGEFTAYNVTFNVEDSDGNPVEGAEIFLEGNGAQTTNASGQTVYNGVFPGVYNFDITKAGLEPTSGSCEVIDQDITVDVIMNIPDYYFYEDFEIELPPDWTTVYQGWNSVYWYNGKVIMFCQGSPGDIMLISPMIDLTNTETLLIEVGNNYGTPSPELLVGTVTDPADPGSFVLIETLSPPTSGFEDMAVDLSTFGGGETYLAFKYGGPTFGYYYIETVKITAASPPPPGCEDFDALTVGGYVAQQLGGYWTTWSGAPGGSEDAIVSNAQSNSPGNSFVVNAGTIDLIYQFGDDPISSGAWLYSHYMYVPSGNSGYFNVQTSPTPGVGWYIELYFNDGGSGTFAGGSTGSFSYNQNTWFLVEIEFDMDAQVTTIYFDGEEVLEFSTTMTIGGIDYYGANTGGAPGAYYDDVCFTEGTPGPILEPPANLVAEEVGEDIVLDWDAPGGGGSGTILCVDRDGSASLGFTDDWQYLQPALNAIGATYDYFEVTDLSQNGPDLATMQQYDIILWFTGESWQNNQTMSNADETNLAAYLSAGGKLFLSAHDYFYDRYPNAGNFSSGQFPYAYLGVSSTSQDFWNIYSPDVASVSGVAGSFAQGITFQVQDIYTTDGKDGLYIDQIVTLGQNLFQVTSPAPSGMAACQFDGGTFRTAFTTVSLAAITQQAPLESVLQAAFTWLMDDDSKELLGYNVYYRFGGTGSFNQIAYVTSSAYVHADAAVIGLHEYYVTAVYTEGESDPSNTAQLLVTSVGKNKLEGYKIYPNPASSQLNISSETEMTGITVYNYAGQVIMSEKGSGKTFRLNVSQYQPGIYMIRVNTTVGIITERVVIE